MRNLDLTTLRSFVAVADTGGVTRAASYLNLTQSAVSMQIKRLEEMLGVPVLDRSGRKIQLTSAGDQLLAYARRMVTLNDEAVGRLTDDAFEGEIVIGVPHDIIYPAIPRVLQQFNAAYPRMGVQLLSNYSSMLRQSFMRGECKMILTTENEAPPEAETLAERPLCWVGAPEGIHWRQKPIRLAFLRQCAFRPQAIAALEQAELPWVMAVDTASDRAMEATVSADLAITAMIDGTEPPQLRQIDPSLLPPLPQQKINFYAPDSHSTRPEADLADLLRQNFRQLSAAPLKAVI
ncbi:LysR family transcriptional regulator [Chachezhania antarctica]|uniref:LysR family transcriptional regulator n=1 Tax=Chachezhania antarctica TaxID=2340860 RepID=UPI000EB4E374|nr:LysR family transcriptional regulator [Chachezhania antarctica]